MNMMERSLYAGFKFHVVRNHERITTQYRLTMTVMVLMALFSALIPTSSQEKFSVNRMGLLSGSLVSSVLIFQNAVNNNPDMSLNPLILFIIIGLLFIFLSFLQYCFISFAWFSVRRKRQVDIVFVVTTSIVYVVFGDMLFWKWKYNDAHKRSLS